MAKARKNHNNPTDSMYNIDNFHNKEQQVIEETQAGIDNLRQSTIDYSLSTASTRSDLIIQRTGLEYERDIHTFIGFLSVVDKLLEEIEDTKKGISKRGLSKAGKKVMEEAKNKLKQYEKQLKGKKKALLKQNKSGRVEIYENDIAHLRGLRQQLDLTRKEIGMGQRGEYASISSYLYNSPETARRSNEYQASNLKFNHNFQDELKKGAVLRIFNGNEEEANKFYRRIAQGEYNEIDYQLYRTNASVLAPSFQRCGIIIPSEPRGREGHRIIQGNEKINGTIYRSADYNNMDWGETFKQGGVSGVFDRLLSNCNNLTPGQRETWRSLGVLACVAGSIYGLYKFYTNKKMGFWAKAGITVGTIFGTEVLLGETPLSLFNKLMSGGLSLEEMKNKFGNAISGISNSGSEASETTVPAMQSMMIFNSGATSGEVQQMTQSFKENNENRRTFYNQSSDKIKGEYGEEAMETFQTTFSDEFDEDKWKNWLASFGITGKTDEKETVYELANNAHMNKVAFEKFLADNKLEPTKDPAKKTELDEYIKSKNEKNESIDLDVLKTHLNDWFSQIPQSTDENEDTEQNTHNVEIKNDTLKPIVESGLTKLFKHFGKIYGSKMNIINLKKDYISTYATGITNDIISKIIKNDGNSIIIDMSDNNIKYVYDNAVEKLAQSQTSILNTFNTLSKRIRSYKRDSVKSWEQTNINQHNRRKNNITESARTLLEEISSYIKSQGGDLKIYRNGQAFSDITGALDSIPIFS